MSNSAVVTRCSRFQAWSSFQHFKPSFSRNRSILLLLFFVCSIPGQLLATTTTSQSSSTPTVSRRGGVPASVIAKDSSYTFPVTPVGGTSGFCTALCFCSDTTNCTCDRSGTDTLVHDLSSPFSAYGYRLEPYAGGTYDCNGGTPVQLPVSVGAGQQLAFFIDFSPTSSGSFSDYLQISDYTYSLSGSTPSGSANLVPYTPTGWSDALVVSTTPGTQANSPTITSNDTLYTSWAVLNNGDEPTSVIFYTDLILDGASLQGWHTPAPLPATFYAFVKDYSFGPLAAGTHKLELVPDATRTLGPSNNYTITLNIQQPSCGGAAARQGRGAACGPSLRLVAKSSNPVPPARVQNLDLAHPTQLTFGLGESFALQVVQVNSDGTNGQAVSSTATVGNQSPASPHVASSLGSSSLTRFSQDVLLSFSADPLNFVPVHSGTATLLISIPSSPLGTVSVPVNIVSAGYSLGTQPTSFASACLKYGSQGTSYDSAIFDYADLRGIPPQLVKGIADKESNFKETYFYRYEPLAFDFAEFSTTAYATTKNHRDWRIRPEYRKYTLHTFPDSADGALSQGSGVNTADLAFRQMFSTTLDKSGHPLQNMSAGTAGKTRTISSSDSPIAMENILYTNDSVEHWLSARPDLASAFVAYRKHHSSFTAQTVLAASYGLTQISPVTAAGAGYMDSDGTVRPPSDLLDTDTNLDVSTNILAKNFGDSEQFATAAAFRRAWGLALSKYNGTTTPGVITLYGRLVLCLSDGYFPVH